MKVKIIIFFIFFIAAIHGRAEDKHNSTTVKIGVIIPLSGDMASHGVEVQRSLKIALDSYDKEKLKHTYELIFEDNQLSPAKSVSAANKLVNIDKVDAIITLWPPTAEVVLPITEKNNILHYTIAWDPNLAKKHKLLLSHQVLVSDIAQSTLKLLKSAGKTRIAFLHLEESGFNLGAKYIKDLSKAEDISIISDETFSPNETDFHSLIAKIEASHPDAYLIWSVAPTIDTLLKQLNERNKKVFKTGYFDYLTDRTQAEGQRYISEMYASKIFVDAYNEKYDDLPKSKGANAFDIINLIISAYENSTIKPDAFTIKEIIKKTKNKDGAVGVFSIDDYGNSSYSPVVRIISDGKSIIAK